MNEESERTFEENIRSVGQWFGRNLPGIFAILIALFFLFTGVVKVSQADMTWQEQTMMTIINIIAGYSITSLVAEYGFTSAKTSPKYRDIESAYNLSVRKGIKYRGAIDEFAYDKATENLKEVRIHLLEGVNLWYWDIFDDDGRIKTDFDIYAYKKDKKFTQKLRIYHKAVKLHVSNISVFNLASSSIFGVSKEKTEKNYRTTTSVKSLVLKVLLSFVTVGIMFTFLGWNVSALIYAFMQIVLWTSMGLIQRQKNFNFIYDEIIPQFETRRLIIDEFMEKTDSEKETYILKANQRKVKVKQLPYIEPKGAQLGMETDK